MPDGFLNRAWSPWCGYEPLFVRTRTGDFSACEVSRGPGRVTDPRSLKDLVVGVMRDLGYRVKCRWERAS